MHQKKSPRYLYDLLFIFVNMKKDGRDWSRISLSDVS